MFGAGSDLHLSEPRAEGWVASIATAEESSMESLSSVNPPEDDSRSVLFCKTRDFWVSGA